MSGPVEFRVQGKQVTVTVPGSGRIIGSAGRPGRVAFRVQGVGGAQGVRCSFTGSFRTTRPLSAAGNWRCTFPGGGTGQGTWQATIAAG